MEENTQPVEVMEQEAPVSTPEPSFTFISDEEVAAAQQGPQEQQPTQEVAPEVEQQETFVEPEVAQPEAQQQYAPEQIEGAVFEFLSERLGRNIASFDDLQAQQQEQRELDERISVIADFVEKTGRAPQDWFIYQQLNPSEMDDMTAIQVQMASDYPNLSQEEVATLMSSKYKLDPNLHTEDEVKLSQLQLKIDAQNARQAIDKLRDQYAAPEVQERVDDSSPFDESWYSSMRTETEALDGVEFDLGNGNTFTFGLNSQYRNELMEKNTRLDEFFDPYVQRDGSWDYDKLNVHRAVLDNMEQIVQSVYRQGMADGQKGIVNQAANVSVQTPNQGGQPQEDSLAAQLRQALGGDSTWSF